MLTLATAALTLAGAVAASGPAAAQRYYRDRDSHGDAVTAGVLGFALGAAVAGNGNTRYRESYYAPRGYGYYRAPPRAYGYGYGYRAPRRCVVERRWDPYWGRSVRVERCW
jgi:hypothetical protein